MRGPFASCRRRTPEVGLVGASLNHGQLLDSYEIYTFQMRPLRVDPDALVVEVASKQPGLRWPIPIDARLDGLVGAANAAGAGTTRKELLAALVLATSPQSSKLRNAVLDLRTATVRQAALDGDVGEYVLRKPGRPRGSRS